MNVHHRILFASIGFLIIVGANSVCASNTDSEGDYLKMTSAIKRAEHLIEIVSLNEKTDTTKPQVESIFIPSELLARFNNPFFTNEAVYQEGRIDFNGRKKEEIILEVFHQLWGQALLHTEVAHITNQALEQISYNNNRSSAKFREQMKTLARLRFYSTWRAANLLDAFYENAVNSKIVGLVLLKRSIDLLHNQPKDQIGEYYTLLARAQRVLNKFPTECANSELFMGLGNNMSTGSNMRKTGLGDNPPAVIDIIFKHTANSWNNQESA